MSPRGTARSPKRLLAGVLAGLAVITGAGWAVGTRLRSPADEAALRRPPEPSLVTSPVVRRKLTSTVTAGGTLEYGSPLPVTLAGVVGGGAEVQRVTRAPRPGTIREGSVLMEVNGRPVFALKGRVPMHRTMTPGTRGRDVEQLQAALRRLGVAVPATGVFDAATAAAVRTWYGRRGYTAQEPDLAARRELETLRQAVQTAEEDLLAARHALARVTPRDSRRLLETKVAHSRRNVAGAKAILADYLRTYGTSVPPGEVVFLSRLPARLDRAAVKPGDVVDGEVATVTASTLVVAGSVDAAEARLLRKGMRATLETGDGRRFTAVLTATGAAARPAAQEETPSGGSAGPGRSTGDGTAGKRPGAVPVLLTPRPAKGLRELVGDPVTAKIAVGATEGEVLTVPVAAVVTSADGRPRVQVELPGDRTRDVPVRTGLAADGSVQVSPVEPGALKEGDRVVVGGA
ncbi:hypothetical protein GCM10010466_16270 [Planomonospora alba]|uniref:Peptidoglycan binding-like domain-containing protein n=1 Tax=Planomonospora alba TaxID=161354 RepID=A0ABP6MUA9_9ACTN